MGRQEAEEELAGVLKAGERLGTKGHNAKNISVASNILHEELGRFGTDHLRFYELDKNTQDRLLAHARQDAAHALCNTISVLEELNALSRRVTLYGGMMLLLLIAIVWKLWY